MGRPQAFDRDEVVTAAREVFWDQGYEGAALPALERATGLSRSSLYHAFGSKRGLFDAAVDSYRREVIGPLIAPLQQAEVAQEAIIECLGTLRAALARVGSAPGSHGCLLVNTAGAPIGREPEIAEAIADHRRMLSRVFAAGVAARDGGLSAERCALLGRVIASLMIAAFALVRVAPEEADRSLADALALVPPAAA